MVRNMKRLTVVPVFSVLMLSLAADQARSQIAGPSASGSRQPVGIVPTSGLMPGNQPSLPSQSNLQLPQSSALGGSAGIGLNQMLPNNPFLGLQQSNSLNGLTQQQQLQLGLYSTIQQAQLGGLLQAQQLQNAMAVGAALRQPVAPVSPARRKQQSLLYDDSEDKPAKFEIKHMEEESDEVVSAKQLKLAKYLKADADTAQFKDDRSEAAKLRAKVGQRLSDIIDKYPKTPAAKEAEKILQNLYP